MSNARSSAHLSAALPAGDKNGLARITSELVSSPETVHVAIVLLQTTKLLSDVSDHSVTPTVGIRAIEPIPVGPDANELRRLLRRQFERRTGLVELPLDLERALEDISIAGQADTDDDGEEPLTLEQLQHAVEIVVGDQRAEAQAIVKRLPCSPERAVELLALMQAQGVISLPDGDTEPDVLVTIDGLAETLDGLRLFAGRTTEELPSSPGDIPDTIPTSWTGGPTFLDGTVADEEPNSEDGPWEYPDGEGTPAEPTGDDSDGGKPDDGDRP